MYIITKKINYLTLQIISVHIQFGFIEFFVYPNNLENFSFKGPFKGELNKQTSRYKN